MFRDIVITYLLNLVYLATLVLQLPRCVWRYFLRGKYRGTLGVRLLGQVERRLGSAHCVWFEAASLGEVRAMESLVRLFQQKHPHWQCVISASTTSGLHLARQLFPDIYVFPLPLDFSWAMRSAVARIRPDLLIIVDIESWQNLLAAARRHGARVAIVNGRMTDRDFRPHLRAKWGLSRALRQIDLITAQTNEYADRFVRLGAPRERVHVVGSLKFDGVETDRNNPITRRLAQLSGIGLGDLVFMAGSTHAGEEKLVLSVYQALAQRYPTLRLVIAPRHAERFPAVARMLERSGMTWQCSSRLQREGCDAQARVLLIDTVGEVAWWWGLSHIAFVGGSLFGGRGKNMLEPAAYRAAVSFGPKMSDFRSIVQDLLRHDAAAMVRDECELTRFVEKCVRDAEFRESLGQRALALIELCGGVTQDTLQYLNPVVACQEQGSGDRQKLAGPGDGVSQEEIEETTFSNRANTSRQPILEC